MPKTSSVSDSHHQLGVAQHQTLEMLLQSHSLQRATGRRRLSVVVQFRGATERSILRLIIWHFIVMVPADKANEKFEEASEDGWSVVSA